MARSLTKIGSLSLLIAATMLVVGCGVKNMPRPRSEVAPRQVTDLAAESVTQGVRVSFGVPTSDKPELAIEVVQLYYGYLPIAGDPDCPPCPPKLRQHRDFNLKAQTPEIAKLMEGGRFSYLDAAAPMNMQAVYRVVLIDASGRESQISEPARAYKVDQAAAPAGLRATPGDAMITVEWRPVTTLASGVATSDISGYLVWRKDAAGEKPLNTVPVVRPLFVDKTVQNGQTYAYRVEATRKIQDINAQGVSTGWVTAQPKDSKAPKSPGDLRAVSQTEGVFLNFRPSADEDVEGYLVFRKVEGPDSSWIQISEELIKDTFYTDAGVEIGVKYFYRVVAVDSSGNRSEVAAEADVEHNKQ